MSKEIIEQLRLLTEEVTAVKATVNRLCRAYGIEQDEIYLIITDKKINRIDRATMFNLNQDELIGRFIGPIAKEEMAEFKQKLFRKYRLDPCCVEGITANQYYRFIAIDYSPLSAMRQTIAPTAIKFD